MFTHMMGLDLSFPGVEAVKTGELFLCCGIGVFLLIELYVV
jgi:hypothetical protein